MNGINNHITLFPGHPGTMKCFKKYRDRLVSIRYKYDFNKKQQFQTVELVFSRENRIPKDPS